jgi:hypothetical protein
MATWATPDDVALELATPVLDTARLAQVTDAANEWAFDRRLAAGYDDDPTVVPSARVLRGVVLLAAADYRSRGQNDGTASYAELAGYVGGLQPAGGNAGMVNRMLGIPRPGAG